MGNTLGKCDTEFLGVFCDVGLCCGIDPMTTDGVDVFVYILV